jgi:hypothetical protein
MNPGLDEVLPPTPEVWAELAKHEMAGDHQFGKVKTAALSRLGPISRLPRPAAALQQPLRSAGRSCS